MARAGFAVDGEQTPQRQLETTAITPRADRVGKAGWLCTAFHPDSAKGVGHKTLTKPGIDRSEHQIRIGGPYKDRWTLGEAGLGGQGGGSQDTAPPHPDIGSAHAKRETAESASHWRRIVERSKELDSAGYLGGKANRYHQIR